MKMLDTVVSRTLGIYSIIREENLQEHRRHRGKKCERSWRGVFRIIIMEGRLYFMNISEVTQMEANPCDLPEYHARTRECAHGALG